MSHRNIKILILVIEICWTCGDFGIKGIFRLGKNIE